MAHEQGRLASSTPEQHAADAHQPPQIAPPPTFTRHLNLQCLRIVHTHRAREEARLVGLTPEQRAAYKRALIGARAQAAAAQAAALQHAMAQGLDVVIDCSYVQQGAGEGEVRSLAKQVEVAMAINRRCGCARVGCVRVCVGVLKLCGCVYVGGWVEGGACRQP